MRTPSILAGCVGILFSVVLVAADPPYVGRWKINEEKSDFGTAFTFAPAEQGALRLTEGDRSYIVRFDGKEYPHPLGGLVRWIRIDDRSWETTYTQNGKLVGNAIYQLSDDEGDPHRATEERAWLDGCLSTEVRRAAGPRRRVESQDGIGLYAGTRGRRRIRPGAQLGRGKMQGEL